MSLDDYIATRQAMHQATADLNELHRRTALSKDVSDLQAKEKHLADAISWHKLAMATMRSEIQEELLADLKSQEAVKESQRQALQREMTTEAGIAGAELAAALESLDSVADPFCASLAGMIRDSFGKTSAAYPGPTATAFADSLLAHKRADVEPLFQRLSAIKPAADLEQAARVAFDRLAGE